jgi:hypothetical protein
VADARCIDVSSACADGFDAFERWNGHRLAVIPLATHMQSDGWPGLLPQTLDGGVARSFWQACFQLVPLAQASHRPSVAGVTPVRCASSERHSNEAQHFYRVTFTVKNAIAAAVAARRSTAGSR